MGQTLKLATQVGLVTGTMMMVASCSTAPGMAAASVFAESGELVASIAQEGLIRPVRAG